jgi:hypothetical protein
MEMPVIPVNKVVDPQKNNRKKWRAEEKERHKGSLTRKKSRGQLQVRNFEPVYAHRFIPWRHGAVDVASVSGT